MCNLGDNYEVKIRFLEDTLFENSVSDIETYGHCTKLFKKGDEIVVEMDGTTGIVYREKDRTWVRLKAEGVYEYYDGILHPEIYEKELEALKEFSDAGFYKLEYDNSDKEIEKFDSVISELNNWYEELEVVPTIQY